MKLHVWFIDQLTHGQANSGALKAPFPRTRSARSANAERLRVFHRTALESLNTIRLIVLAAKQQSRRPIGERAARQVG